VGHAQRDRSTPTIRRCRAVAAYLSFRRDERDEPADELLQRAADAEYEGAPPPELAGSLSQRL
jgi:hypothetical protein